MARWRPGTRERLAGAALDLYVERGFEQTTVAEIAERAGVTERTFFRHFADKREVLFDGQDVLEQTLLRGVADAPPQTPARDVVAAALAAAADVFPDGRREWSRRRQAVITANPPLQERELLKLAGLAEALADGMRARGTGEPEATLAARSATAVFEVAFGQWVADGEDRPYAQLARDVLDALVDLTSQRQQADR